MVCQLALKLRNKLALKKELHLFKTVPFQEAHRIGILAEDLNKNKKAIENLIAKIKAEGKEVDVLCLSNVKEIQKQKKDFHLFSKKDISWKGNFKKIFIEDFIKTDFDFLFDLSANKNLALDNILARSKAKCRIGIFNEKREKYLDLMISPKKQQPLEHTVEQMIQYSKLI